MQRNARTGFLAFLGAAVLGLGFTVYVPLYNLFAGSDFAGTTQVTTEAEADLAEKMAAWYWRQDDLDPLRHASTASCDLAVDIQAGTGDR
ncbi:MAG: hypothetical protein R3E18_02980 [Sphingomonadaceae bacterium]